MSDYTEIPVESWEYYKSPLEGNTDDRPFEILHIDGQHHVISETEKFEGSGYNCQSYSQLALYDVWDFGSYKSGYIKGRIRGGYKVRMCFKIISRSPTSMSYFSRNFTPEGSSFGTFNQECITKIYRGIPKVTHKQNVLGMYSCRQFDFVGGDEFEFDIDSNFQGEGSSFKLFSISLNGNIIAQSRTEALDETLIISIHSVYRTTEESSVGALSAAVVENAEAAIFRNQELELRHQVVNLAKSYLNDPFYWGGNTPELEGGNGTDCSGFVIYVMNKQFPSLNWEDRTSAGLSRILKRSISPSPGDLVFFENSSGKVVHVDIFAGVENGSEWVVGSYGGSNQTRGNDASACVKLRNLSTDTRTKFYCSISEICAGEIQNQPLTNISSIDMGNHKTVTAVQAYLKSQGLFSGQLTGEECEKTRRGVRILQKLFIQYAGISEDAYEELGQFDDTLFMHIKTIDLNLEVNEMTNIQQLLENHSMLTLTTSESLSEEDHIRSYNDPFEVFMIGGPHSYQAQKLQFQNEPFVFKMIPCNGWRVRLKIWGPEDYFLTNIPNGKYLPNIGSWCNKNGTSYVEIELNGGDEFFLRNNGRGFSNCRKCNASPCACSPSTLDYAEVVSPTNLPPAESDYVPGNLHLTLNQEIVTEHMAPAPHGNITIEIFEIFSPHSTEWQDYSIAKQVDWGGVVHDKNWKELLMDKMGITEGVNRLNSNNDSLEAEVKVEGQMGFRVLSAAGYKVQRLNELDYSLDSRTTLGAGLEFGMRTCAWNKNLKYISKRKTETAAGAYFAINLSVSATYTWTRTYKFYGDERHGGRDSKDNLLKVLPYGLMSAAAPLLPLSYFESSEVQNIINRSYASETLLISLNGSAQALGGFNFDLPNFLELNLFNIGYNYSFSGKIGGFITFDYHENKNKTGLIFEVNLAVNVFVSLGLLGGHTPENKWKTRGVNEAGATDVHQDLFSSSASKTIFAEIMLYEDPMEYSQLASENNKFMDEISDNENKESLDKVRELLGNKPQINSNTNAQYTKLIIPLEFKREKISLEVEIKFKSTVWSSVRAIVAMSTSESKSVIEVLRDLSEDHRFEDLEYQIYKIDSSNFSKSGTYQFTNFGLYFGIDVESKDYQGMHTDHSGPTIKPTTYKASQEGYDMNNPADRQAQLEDVRSRFIQDIRRWLVMR